MKRYRVYIEHGCVGCPPEEEICEFPDDATQKEIDDGCSATLQVLFENLDSGWYELDPEDP